MTRVRCLTTAGVAVALVLSALAGPAPRAGADDPTVSYDAQRTGWDPNEAGLSAASVAAADFGDLFESTLPKPAGATANQLYAQPVVAGGTLVVATEENQLDGLDPATGKVRWTTSLGSAWPAATSGCGDLTPDVGVTSTPVYDSATNTVYAVGKVDDGPDAAHPDFKMAALDATTGELRPGWPVVISGAPTNDPYRQFDALHAGQRAGLLLLGGRVYVGFASHCSYLPYVGYVASVDTASRAVRLWTTEAGGTGAAGGGVWQSGGGLVSDGAGQVVFATGNGFDSASPAAGPGTAPPQTLAESVVRLSVADDATMTATDFFSPNDNPLLDRNDTDLGSGAPIALPTSFGTSSHRHLLLTVGKQGKVFLLDRDHLGGMGQGKDGADAALSETQIKGVWGHPAAWPGDGGYVYVVENSGNLRALRITPDSSGTPTVSVAGASTETFGYTSGSPVVTSSGTTSGSALVWVVQSSGPTGADARLLAYDAVPAAGVLRLRYAAPLGTVAKFVVPATDGGRVYVATRDGRVLAFGRPGSAALNAAPVDFGAVAVGTGASAPVVLRANRTVTVTGVNADRPFSVDPVAVPVTLTAGQTLTAPATFTPTAPTSAAGLLRVATTDAGTVLVDLRGLGTAPGLAADPDTVDFAAVGLGHAQQAGVSVRNTGTTPVTISAVHGPAAPFSVSGAPAAGAVLAPQATLTFTATAAPVTTRTVTDYVRIFWSGHHVRIALTVTGVNGAAHLSLTPSTLDLGRVAPGATATAGFDIANTGTAPLTLTKAAPPAAPFAVLSPVPEGSTLPPGAVIHQAVSLTPTSALPATGSYAITADDGAGEQQVEIEANTEPPVGAVTIGDRCLSAADPAHPVGSAVQLAACVAGAEAQAASIPGDGTLALAGACLQTTAGSAGSPVSLAACANVGTQKWNWAADQTVANRKSALCLALPTGVTPAAGTPVVLHSCLSQPGRRFDLGALIASRGFVTGIGGLCLDARGAKSVTGTPVQTWRCNASAAQLVAVPPGTDTLQILGACLQLTADAAGAAVVLAPCTGQAGAQWAPQPDRSLVNPASGLCLDVPRGTTNAGQQLQAWTCNASAAQRWVVPA